MVVPMLLRRFDGGTVQLGRPTFCCLKTSLTATAIRYIDLQGTRGCRVFAAPAPQRYSTTRFRSTRMGSRTSACPLTSRLQRSLGCGDGSLPFLTNQRPTDYELISGRNPRTLATRPPMRCRLALREKLGREGR